MRDSSVQLLDACVPLKTHQHSISVVALVVLEVVIRVSVDVAHAALKGYGNYNLTGLEKVLYAKYKR